MNGRADGEGVFFTRPEKSQLEKWKAWLLGTEIAAEKSGQDANQQLGLF